MSTSTPAASPAPRRPAGRRGGEITAERILDAAEALFAERGYDGTTLRDVATRVGIRIPSLYNHFDGKDSLYAAVLDRGIRPVVELLTEFVQRGGPPDSPEIIRRVMAMLARRPRLPRLVMHETVSGGQRLTPMLRNWIAPTFSRAFEMVEASGGEWRPEQTKLVVLAMYHVVVGYFAIAPLYHQLSGEDLLSPEAMDEQTRFLADFVAKLFPDRTRSS
jgi:AcrR family transcriptional regulator